MLTWSDRASPILTVRGDKHSGSTPQRATQSGTYGKRQSRPEWLAALLCEPPQACAGRALQPVQVYDGGRYWWMRLQRPWRLWWFWRLLIDFRFAAVWESDRRFPR